MAIHLSGGSGCVIVLAILFVPAAVVAYLLNDSKWLVIIPAAIVALGVFVAALPIKRKVTPQRWASELEPHLLGTDGPWDWDDATSIALADPKLEVLRRKLHKFDALSSDERRREFENVVATLKRGEIPEVSDEF
jgi:hypothetical protein